MKFDVLKVFVFVICVLAFFGGLLGVIASVDSGDAAGAGFGFISGGALVALAILHYTDRVTDRRDKDSSD